MDRAGGDFLGDLRVCSLGPSWLPLRCCGLHQQTQHWAALRAFLWLPLKVGCHSAAAVYTGPAKHLGSLARAAQSGSSTGCAAQNPGAANLSSL